MRILMPILGAAIAVAGIDKLAGQRGYTRLFHHLGWSDNAKRAVAGAETLGGALMVLPATRRLGGAAVAAVSTLMLVSEVRHDDVRLVAPRGLVLLAGLVALLASPRN